MSLLEQDRTRERRVDEDATQLKFELNDNEEYEVKGIQDSAIYAKKLEAGHLPKLYYLVFEKSYLKEKDTWKLSLVVMHLKKIVSTFYKDHPEKSTSTSIPLNSALPMAKLIVKLFAKQK